MKEVEERKLDFVETFPWYGVSSKIFKKLDIPTLLKTQKVSINWQFLSEETLLNKAPEYYCYFTSQLKKLALSEKEEVVNELSLGKLKILCSYDLIDFISHFSSSAISWRISLIKRLLQSYTLHSAVAKNVCSTCIALNLIPEIKLSKVEEVLENYKHYNDRLKNSLKDKKASYINEVIHSCLKSADEGTLEFILEITDWNTFFKDCHDHNHAVKSSPNTTSLERRIRRRYQARERVIDIALNPYSLSELLQICQNNELNIEKLLEKASFLFNYFSFTDHSAMVLFEAIPSNLHRRLIEMIGVARLIEIIEKGNETKQYYIMFRLPNTYKMIIEASNLLLSNYTLTGYSSCGLFSQLAPNTGSSNNEEPHELGLPYR